MIDAIANQRWNLVLIVSDDHGREATGCYGNPVVRTPNLDELARDGVRFDNTFCTTASCAASRSVILTGLHNHATGTYGHTHGVHHFSCFPHIRTLLALLLEAGYRTRRAGAAITPTAPGSGTSGIRTGRTALETSKLRSEGTRRRRSIRHLWWSLRLCPTFRRSDRNWRSTINPLRDLTAVWGVSSRF